MAGGSLAPTTPHLESLAGGPGRELVVAGLLPAIERAPLDALDLAAVILVLALLWPVTRRFGSEYGVLLIARLIPPLLFGLPASAGRQTAVLFPVFIYIAAAVRPAHRWRWLAFCAMLQAVVACVFFTGRSGF